MTSPKNVQQNKTHLLEKSSDLLGWPLIQEALSGYACSLVTSNLCRALVPYEDVKLSNNALDTTTEMLELLASGDSFPINPFDNFIPILDEANKRQILDPVKCLSVLKLLRVARNVRSCIEKQIDLNLLLRLLCLYFPPDPMLLRENLQENK